MFVCPLHATSECAEKRVQDGLRVWWCTEDERVTYRIDDACDSEAWKRYDAWNRALAGTLFDGRAAGRPVYLDLEEPLLTEMARLVGTPPARAGDDFARAVSGTVPGVEMSGADLFGGHVARLETWKQTPLGPPPHLALLGVFSLAADRMEAGEDTSSTNYYARLQEVLRRPDDEADRNRLGAAYRGIAVRLWRAYELWLEDKGGALGLPTVAPGGAATRYIGYPLSQALLRSADLQVLPTVFTAVGLDPGDAVAPEDLLRILRSQLAQQHLTFQLKRLLARDHAAALQVAELVGGELAGWRGAPSPPRPVRAVPAAGPGAAEPAAGITPSQEPSGKDPDARLRLMAAISSPLFGERLRLGALVDSDADGGSLAVDGSASSMYTPLDVVGPGARHVDLPDLDNSTWLSRTVRLTTATTAYRRDPQLTVILRRDESLGMLVEQDRLTLGDEHVVLLPARRAKRAFEILEPHARPSPRLDVNLDGLPNDWAAIRDLQLLDVPDAPEGELSRFVPVAWTRLAFQGGVRLPGRTRRYHRFGLPEVGLTDASGGAFTLHVEQAAEDREILRDGPFEGAGVIDLRRHRKTLPPGVYRVCATRDGEDIATATFHLCEAFALPSESAEAMPSVGHDPDVPEHALTAADPADEASFRGCATPDAAQPATQAIDVPIRQRWTTNPSPPSSASRALQPRLGTAADTPPCFARGAHRFEFPDWDGRSRAAEIEGRCECGYVIYCPGRPPKQDDDSRTIIEHRALPPLPPPTGLNLDYLFDALTFLCAGTWAEFGSLVRQRSDSALDVEIAGRRLEALGHIDVVRDKQLRAERWQIAPPVLYTTAGGEEAVLAGARTPGVLRAVKDAASASGATFTVERDERPARISVSGTAAQIRQVGHSLGDEIRFGTQPSLQLAWAWAESGYGALATRAEVLPPDAELDLFDLESGRWMPSSGSAAGAYRIRQPGRHRYALRTHGDVQGGVFRPGPHWLVRHLAARQVGIALVAWEPATSQLTAPARVGLPPMLQRAAVLCTGRYPRETDDGRSWVYDDVPREVAAGITATLLAPAEEDV